MKKGAKISFTLQEIAFFCMIISCIALYDFKMIFLGTQVIAVGTLIIKRYCALARYAKSYILWGISFGLFAVGSKIWALPSNGTVFLSTMSFFQVLVIGYIVLDYYQDTKKIDHILIGYLSGCMLLVIRFFIEIPIKSWGLQTRFPRSSIFGGNGPAISLSYAAVILLGLIIQNRGKKNTHLKFFELVLVCVFVFVSFLMGTRKAIIILLLGVVLFILLEADTFKKKISSLFMVFIILTGVYLFVSRIPVIYNSVGYRLESMVLGLSEKGVGDASFDTRRLFIKDAFNVWKKNLFIGIGQDGYRYVNSISRGYYSHNNFVEILANLGLIGFVIYYGFFVSLIKNSIKVIKKDYMPFVLLVIILIIDYFRVSYSAENSFILVAIVIIMLSEQNKCEV